MIDAGFFESGERVELLNGEILQVPPQKSLHATGIQLVQDALSRAFGPECVIRNQMPLALAPHSEPEPDIAVVAGAVRDYCNAHPSTALLIVEVSDTTLELDRRRKSAIYARAGIRDFWIVNLIDRCVEVFRDPEQDNYRYQCTLNPGEKIAPLSAPESVISISNLLP
jgi:Uma2 family endonuclease